MVEGRVGVGRREVAEVRIRERAAYGSSGGSSNSTCMYGVGLRAWNS